MGKVGVQELPHAQVWRATQRGVDDAVTVSYVADFKLHKHTSRGRMVAMVTVHRRERTAIKRQSLSEAAWILAISQSVCPLA